MNENAPDRTDFALRLRDVQALLRMNLHLIAAFAAAVLVVGILVTALTTREYKSTALLHITPNVGQEIKVDEVAELDVRGFQESERYYRTQFELLKTRSFLKEVLRRYADHGFTDLDPDEHVGRLRKILSVYPRERSQLVELSVIHESPQAAAVLANLAARVYVDQNLEGRRDAAREAKLWLEQKLAEYEEKVDAASRDVLGFKEQNDLVDAEEEVTTLSEQISSLDEALAAVATEHVLLATKIGGYEDMLAAGRYAELAEHFSSPLLETLTATMAEARAEQATLASRYGERHPAMRRVQARLTSLEEDLKREVENAVEAERAQLSVLAEQEESLEREIDEHKAQLLERQRLQTDYASLKLELDRSSEFYRTLSRRSDEMDLSSRTQLNNARIVDEAVPAKAPVKPNVFMNLFVSLLAGVAGGIALALIRSYVDDAVSRPADIETFLDIPYMGLVPSIPHDDEEAADDLYTHHSPDSIQAEAMRSVRAMLELGGAGHLEKLLVTSSMASEGKTSTSIRLGIAFAQQGQKVLLIDADHRRARVHKSFGMPRDVGLVSCLKGLVSGEEAVLATEVPNLYVMPAGPKSDEANRLLTTDAMRELIDQMAEKFDRVIVDTPPAATLSEAVHLSRMVDGVLLVIRSGQLARGLAQHTVRRFKQVQANIVGAILNDVPIHKMKAASSYYYGYDSYGYAYGYAEEESGEDVERAAK